MNVKIGATSALIVAAAVFTFDVKAYGQTVAPLCEREITRAANAFDVPISVLYAIGLNESGRRSQMTPFALNVAGASVFPSSREEALAIVRTKRSQGIKLIDVGCMQINIHYHMAKFRSLEEMFEPRINVEYAARLVRDLRKQTGTWTMAVARYHAGPGNPAAQKRYVCAVIHHMVAAGVGEWTPNARASCRT